MYTFNKYSGLASSVLKTVKCIRRNTHNKKYHQASPNNGIKSEMKYNSVFIIILVFDLLAVRGRRFDFMHFIVLTLRKRVLSTRETYTYVENLIIGCLYAVF